MLTIQSNLGHVWPEAKLDATRRAVRSSRRTLDVSVIKPVSPHRRRIGIPAPASGSPGTIGLT